VAQGLEKEGSVKGVRAGVFEDELLRVQLINELERFICRRCESGVHVESFKWVEVEHGRVDGSPAGAPAF